MRYINRLFFLFLYTISGAVYGQFVSVPYTVPTPYGNANLSYRVYMPHNYYGGNANPKYKFEVTLKNDSVIKLKSKMLVEDKNLYVVLKEKKSKRKIFPNETKEVIGYSEIGKKTGIPADTCWLFRIKEGNINCYSSIPTEDLHATIAIQKGTSGEILTLSKENLKSIAETTDAKIQKWIDKGDFVKAIKRYNELPLDKPNISNE